MILGDVATYYKFQVGGKSVRLFGISQPYTTSECPEKVDNYLPNYIEEKINTYKFNGGILDIYLENSSMAKIPSSPEDPMKIILDKYNKCLTTDIRDENYFSACPQAKKNIESSEQSISTRFNYLDIKSLFKQEKNVIGINTAIDYFYGNRNELINDFKSKLTKKDLEEFKNQSNDTNIKEISNDFLKKNVLSN